VPKAGRHFLYELIFFVIYKRHDIKNIKCNTSFEARWTSNGKFLWLSNYIWIWITKSLEKNISFMCKIWCR